MFLFWQISRDIEWKLVKQRLQQFLGRSFYHVNYLVLHEAQAKEYKKNISDLELVVDKIHDSLHNPVYWAEPSHVHPNPAEPGDLQVLQLQRRAGLHLHTRGQCDLDVLNAVNKQWFRQFSPVRFTFFQIFG